MYGRNSRKTDVAIDAFEREYGYTPNNAEELRKQAAREDANRLAFHLFMAEAEGYLDTHDGKVNAMLKDLCDKHDRGITYMNLNQDYVEQFGLDIEDLTQSDVNRCERALLSGRY
jgi:hypothetical protein